MPLTQVDEIEALLSESRTAESFARLRATADTQPPEWSGALLLLEASWSNLEQEIATGVISSEEAEVRRNRIHASLLQLLRQPETGGSARSTTLDELRQAFLPPETAPDPEPASTDVSGSTIEVEDSQEVIIGSGNTISKQIFHALGRWQFLAIVGVLVLIIGFIFFGGSRIQAQQEAAFASLSLIHEELKKLSAEDGQIRGLPPESRAALDANIDEGMRALQEEQYQAAIEHFEAVVARVPLATVHKNLAYAYEQTGNYAKAGEHRREARRLDPALFPEKTLYELRGQRINLLAPEHGPKMLAASDPGMARVMDENFDAHIWAGWAVFGFKDGQPATIDQLDFYVPGSNDYLANLELLVSNDAPTGPFTSIGKFEPFNGLLTETPFQPFPFSPVRARYFKLQVLNPSEGICYEIRLWGTIE